MKLHSNIIHTDKVIPKKHDAFNLFFVILIRPEFKGDEGLLAHEMVHTEQVLRTKGLHIIKMLVSKEYRFESEAEAYATSVNHGMKMQKAAVHLHRDYNTRHTYSECYNKICDYLSSKGGV